MLLRSLYHRNNHRSMGGGDPLALNGHHKDRAFPTKTIADGNQKPVLTNASKQPVVPINVINLDKDKARWDKVILELQNKGGQLVERFPAVYGKALSEEELVANTTPLARIFCTRPVIGCFLSHRNAWMKVLKSTKFPYQVILEDDAIIACNNFSERIQDLVEELESNGETRDQWDILMLGGIACVHPEQDYGLNILDAMLVGGTRKPRFIDNSTRIHVPYRPEGCHGYVVSKRGAQKLLRRAYKANFMVDEVAFGDPTNSSVYICHPMLVYQDQTLPSTLGMNEVGWGISRWIPNWDVDPYTKVKLKWAVREPLIQMGRLELILTTERLIQTAIAGVLLNLVLFALGKIPALAVPLPAILTSGTLKLFVQIMLNTNEGIDI